MASSNTLPHDLYATTVADMQSIRVAPLDDGTKCWVNATHENYYLSRTSGLAVDGVNVIAPVAQAAAGATGAQWLSERLLSQEPSASASIIDDQAGLNSQVFADVPELVVGIITGAGALDVEYDITGTAAVAGAIFRVTIDGVEAAIGGTNVTESQIPVGTSTAAASARIGGITAGAHTVKVQYMVGVDGSVSIRPETEAEHGTLNVSFLST